MVRLNGAPANPPPPSPPVPPTMALVTLAALFFSFAFAVIGAAHLIHAFVASNDQVKYLRAAIPQGTVLDVNRSGETTRRISLLFSHLVRLSAQISQPLGRFRLQSKGSSSALPSYPHMQSSNVRKLARNSSSYWVHSSPLPHFGFYPSRSPSRLSLLPNPPASRLLSVVSRSRSR